MKNKEGKNKKKYTKKEVEKLLDECWTAAINLQYHGDRHGFPDYSQWMSANFYKDNNQSK